MNALSPAHIAPNEIWARRSGALCATCPSAPAQARNLGESRATTTRLSQGAPNPAPESRAARGVGGAAESVRWGDQRFVLGPVRMGGVRLERAISCL